MLIRLAIGALGCVLPCPAAFAIRDVTLIDGSGGAAQPHATVVIQGDRIAAAGPLRATPIPKGARIIDGRGKVVIPGLWDMHVHLWDKQNVLPLYVAEGVTGVRDMGSDFGRVSAWRKEVEDGKAIGPHILTSGPVVDGTASTFEKLPALVAETPEDARRVFDQLDAMGVDFVKVISGVPHDAYIALAERARHWKIGLAGHVPDKVTAREAVEARQNSIEHMFGELIKLSDADAKELFERSALMSTRQVPTLTLWQRMMYIDVAARVKDPRLRLVPAGIRATWPKPEEELKHAPDAESPDVRKQLEVNERRLRQMKECGVEILAGTDTGDPWTIPGVTLHQELELLVKAGLTPMEAIRSATALPAKFLGWDESVGLVKSGFAADLVLLNADPLADIRNVAKIAGVSIRGRFLARRDLDKILAGSGR